MSSVFSIAIAVGSCSTSIAERAFIPGPPMLIVGRGSMISTLDVQRLVIPMVTEFGKIEIQVALKLTGAAAHRAA